MVSYFFLIFYIKPRFLLSVSARCLVGLPMLKFQKRFYRKELRRVRHIVAAKSFESYLQGFKKRIQGLRGVTKPTLSWTIIE